MTACVSYQFDLNGETSHLEECRSTSTSWTEATHTEISSTVRRTYTVDLVNIVCKATDVYNMYSTAVPVSPKHLLRGYTVLEYKYCLRNLVLYTYYGIDSQHVNTMLFPKSLQKGNTASETMLISSTVTCHLHCCMAESYQKERVKKKEFILHTTAATTKMEKIYCPSRMWPHREILNMKWTQALLLKQFKSIRIYINVFV